MEEEGLDGSPGPGPQRRTHPIIRLRNDLHARARRFRLFHDPVRPSRALAVARSVRWGRRGTTILRRIALAARPYTAVSVAYIAIELDRNPDCIVPHPSILWPAILSFYLWTQNHGHTQRQIWPRPLQKSPCGAYASLPLRDPLLKFSIRYVGARKICTVFWKK